MAAVLTEEIASNLEEVAEVTRQIDGTVIRYFFGGVGVGLALGFYFGWRYNREKIRAEAFKESKEEIEKLRESYAVKERAAAARQKPSVEEVVEERGYSTNVTPPQADEVMVETRLKPPVPVAPARPAPTCTNMVGWDYDTELLLRENGEPYVIHQDERYEKENMNQVVYTYWAVDDVLTDEDNRPLPHAQEIVGLKNLKFGHGTDDDDVVFVRNEDLELEMEICRTHQSYAEEVLGHDPPDQAETSLEHSTRSRPQKRRKRKR
jgi:hypothetical protein